MADLRPKRIAEVAARFRVESGGRFRLPHDFDHAFVTRQVKNSEAKATLAEGVELL